MAAELFSLKCLWSFSCCFLLSVTYVGSLYIWGTCDNRNHPDTVKKRCFSVFIISLLSPWFVVIGKDSSYFGENTSLLTLMGIKFDGLISAIFLPLFLTMLLFMGPLFLHYLDGVYGTFLNKNYWKNNLKNLLWLRNHLVAPFSEEFTFRACMLPILVPCFGVKSSIFICPLFFGIAHLHHLIERLENKCKFKQAILISLFQFFYTTIFGMYSTYLFLRTGHFTASFVAHAFCNYMGFPDFGEVFNYRQPMKTVIQLVFILGLSSWIFLLPSLTEPWLYRNNIYWRG